MKIGKHQISYKITQRGVHILHDASLTALFNESPISGVKKLVNELKEAFYTAHGRELAIHHDSLVLEIWGHYYFEKYYKYFRWMIPSERLKKRFDMATQEFDCGEKQVDNNRWIWDLLRPTLPLAQIFLKDQIQII